MVNHSAKPQHQEKGTEDVQTFSPNSMDYPIRAYANETSTNLDINAFRKLVRAGTIKITRRAFPKEFNSWKNAKQRCKSPKPEDSQYRDIAFSKNFDRFRDFLYHIGPKPKQDDSLDRISNNKGYVPGNVRWASPSTQASNRRSTIFFNLAGETKPLKDWATAFNLLPKTVYGRYQRGDRAPDVLFRPVAVTLANSRKAQAKSADLLPERRQTFSALNEIHTVDHAPLDWVPVRSPANNRDKFFRSATRREREANERHAEEAARIKERENQEAQKFLQIASRLRSEFSPYAWAWRNANGIDHALAREREDAHRQFEKEVWKDEIDRAKSGFEKLDKAAKDLFGVPVNSRAIAKLMIKRVPELEEVLPDTIAACLGLHRPVPKFESIFDLSAPDILSDEGG